MKEAQDQSSRIRKEAKERLDELSASANRMYMMPDGSTKLMSDPAAESQINQEAEKRINDLMEQARKRAADQR